MITAFNSALEKQNSTQVIKGSARWSTEDIVSLAGNLSAEFQMCGVQKGEKILLKSPNGIEHFVVFLACEKMQLLYVPVFSEITDAEYDSIKTEMQYCREVVFHSATESFEVNSVESATESAEQGKRDAEVLSGCLFKTSGTTSKQKYIFHSFENLWTNAGIAADGQRITSQSKILSLLTFSHMGGFCMQSLPALRAGATIIIEDKSNYAAVAAELASATHSILVPSMFRYLREFCDNKGLKFSNNPLIVTGSVPVGNSTLKQMLDLGLKVQVIYGLTEMGPYVSRYELNSFADLKDKDFYLGAVMPGYNLKLESQTGEILLDGPCKGKIYEPLTGVVSDLPHEGPMVRTGDAAYASESEFYFTGRFSQTINVGGFKVSPQEIENVILAVPAVEACIVVSEKHFSLGEVPVAYVKSKNRDSDVIYKKIHDNLVRYKWPRKIIFVDTLPETSIGKIRRAVLS